MNVDLSKKEIRQIRDALRTRVDDLNGLSYKARVVGNLTAGKQLNDAANECRELLKKIEGIV